MIPTSNTFFFILSSVCVILLTPNLWRQEIYEVEAEHFNEPTSTAFLCSCSSVSWLNDGQRYSMMIKRLYKTSKQTFKKKKKTIAHDQFMSKIKS